VSRTKRLIKSSKLYWADTALAMSIAGEYEPREAHLENPVVNDLLAWHDTTARPSEVMYWRTMAGQEVDIVIETPQGQLIPIEVKATSRPSTKMIAPLRTFMDEYEDLVLGGLLLHAGEETFWISPKVLAVSWWRVS
jgi:predicted AAA+ superfamily ATPase